MRALTLAVLVGCHSATPAPPPKPAPVAPPAVEPVAAPAARPVEPAPVPLAADTPETTLLGNTFVAPAGWTLVVRGAATVLAPPEPDAHIVIADVQAKDAEDAVARAWDAYGVILRWKVQATNDQPDRDGWTNARTFNYETSPNEKRDVIAGAHRSGDAWNVILFDMPQAVEEKRGGQIATVFSQLLPKGGARESFAGRVAHRLDAARIAELGKFIETGEQATGTPGVALGLVEDGKVVFAGGFGVRELGGKSRVDGDTLFMIASNTKALTTLMLAKLVDDKLITWDTPATQLLPTFKLGDAATTSQVLVKHLICACTGLPRADLEWLLQFKGVTAKDVVTALGGIQPTSKFGEMFQYSNSLAAVAGYLGGHVAFPKLELGAAYDKAMAARVFGPLGMTATTFDYARALHANHAAPHGFDVDGKPARAVMEINYAVVPLRPAGAAWSNVRDMLKYVQMELAEGVLPGGKRYINKAPLLERRAPQVSIGKTTTYGMGLEVDTTYGVPVVHHGGDLIGYHSDMIWLPDQRVGAVILTNGDGGSLIRSDFSRKLLEVLFDGKPEADARVAAGAKALFNDLAIERKVLNVPALAGDVATLAAHYSNASLGAIDVIKQGATTVFDFGEWKTDIASRHNPDGTVSFVAISPGVAGFEFLAAKDQTLVVRDAQHEYTFTSK